ncbi:MAG: tyrosine-type recombinase/integrase [Planctomycetia bacterium]|nr:tyrosine-type recombinase/integrase [Planctomycetia bacterium]
MALWRVGGLRQQEPLGLTWNCVLWEKRRLIVPSPKTSRYEGRENREIPLFPILWRELQASQRIAPSAEPYIVFENRRQNFDSGFKRILFWAGLEPWQKLFQNMRCSCENDLIEDGYPAHVVGAWLGHTSKVQQRHYLRVLDSFYENAVK